MNQRIRLAAAARLWGITEESGYFFR